IGVRGNRRITTAFYTLKIGHGYLKDYLFRIGKSTNNRCQCGARENAEHLLRYCQRLSASRTRTIRSSKTMQDLLGTRKGVEETLAFIEATGIATRKWHLNRAGEEEVIGG
ncbi:hypothetical protein M433DRAFT_270524, partial [Acidomyces richmondensis BFW]